MHPTVRAKLLGLAGLLLVFIGVSHVFFLVNLASAEAQADALYADRAIPLDQLGALSTTFMDLRRLVTAGVMSIADPAEQTQIDAAIAADKSQIDQTVAAYSATSLDDAEKAGLSDFNRLYPQYLLGVAQVRSDTLAHNAAAAMTGITNLKEQVGAPLTNTIDTLRRVNEDDAKRLDDSIASEVGFTRAITIAGLAGSLVIGIAVALMLARAMVRSVTEVQRMTRTLSEDSLTKLAEGMARLRDGDLTFAVETDAPRIEHYPRDEIGRTAEYANGIRDKVLAAADAYNEARLGMASTLRDVQAAAASVARTSEQLNAAAAQTGFASQQVATTISQVAGGTAEQARAASDTNAAVAQLSEVIAQVSASAARGSAAVEHAMAGVEQMKASLAASNAARADLAPVNERAGAALDKVAGTLRESADGMARIKTAVDESAVKVAELGAKGDQIGAIVETIDDIAEQTNLLALNAAIEAARAGEMGKGFAVVADEVRKLAERSGRATKEIAALIQEVQLGTQHAVDAMNAGAAQVEDGLEIGRRSAASVEEILEATRIRNAGAVKVYAAMDEIAAMAGEMNRTSEEIAQVVTDTAEGASRMATSSEIVRGSMGSIAAVSEENSAAAEEVSAATEEMSAQAEEVVASAATLADMAAQLDALVARFRLDAGTQDGSASARPAAKVGGDVVHRRRVGDWATAA